MDEWDVAVEAVKVAGQVACEGMTGWKDEALENVAERLEAAGEDVVTFVRDIPGWRGGYCAVVYTYTGQKDHHVPVRLLIFTHRVS